MEQTCHQSSTVVTNDQSDDDVKQRCERLEKSIAELQEQRHSLGIDTYDDIMIYQEGDLRQQIEKQHKQDAKQLEKFQEQMDQHLGGHFEFVDKPTNQFKFEIVPNGDGTANCKATRIIQRVLKFIKAEKDPKRLTKRQILKRTPKRKTEKEHK